MGLGKLQQAWDQEAQSQGRVLVDAYAVETAGLRPRPGFDALLTEYLGLASSLEILTQAVPSPSPASPDDGVLVFSGTAHLLGVPVSLDSIVVTVDEDLTTDLTLSIALPGSWMFGDSFPPLAGGPFSELTPGGQLVFTTVPASPPQHLVYTGALDPTSGLLAAAVEALQLPGGGSSSIFVSGTLEPRAIFEWYGGSPTLGSPAPPGLDSPLGTWISMPAVTLSAPLSYESARVGPYELSQPQLLLEAIPAMAKDGSEDIYTWFSLVFVLAVEGQPALDVKLTWLPGASTLFLTMIADRGNTSLTELLGGDYLEGNIPPPLADALAEVELKGFSVAFNTSSLAVVSLQVSLGATTSASLGGCTIDNLQMDLSVFSPTSDPQAAVSFSGDLSFSSGDFDALFELEMSYEEGDFVVSARYDGNLSSSELIEKLSNGGVIVPEGVPNLTLSCLEASFVEMGSVLGYSIYGQGQVDVELPLLGASLAAKLGVLVSSGSTDLYGFMGGVTLGGMLLSVSLTLDGGLFSLRASLSPVPGTTIDLGDVLADLGFQLPPLPPALDELSLPTFELTYESGTDQLVVLATWSQGKVVVVSLSPQGSEPRSFFALLEVELELSDLPLVGSSVSSLVSALDVALVVASEPTTDAATIAAVNAAIPPGYPRLPASGIVTEVTVNATGSFGGPPTTVSVPLGVGGSGGTDAALMVTRAGALAGAAAPATAGGSVVWLPVQQSFGPVSIQKIGVGYASATETLSFELDATIALGPLALTLIGLGFGWSLETKALSFTLQGIGVSYSNPPLTIAGALASTTTPGSTAPAYVGEVVIGTDTFAVTAIGFYGTTANGAPAFFVFLDVAEDFGGPPAFFVTGLAAGFGYDTALAIPTLDQVAAFPFLAALTGAGTLGGGGATPATVLTEIMTPPPTPPWVSVAAGGVWLAAGVTFTSFQLVLSKVILVVQDQGELAFTLLGTSSAQYPQAGGHLYASLELELEASLVPAQGVFSIAAVLASSSFVIDPACKVTGGFAYDLWFGSNPHAGDFVLTLGGYNPAFEPPSYYPTVPNLGFHWALDPDVSITGGCYLALTPAVFMAGVELDATYQSGNLSAWFDAWADVVIEWTPFFFIAEIGISLGASFVLDLLVVKKKVTIELGCSLEVWGPPTGGIATVHWWVLSFSVPFGTALAQSQTAAQGRLDWSAVAAMLPSGTTSSAASTAAAAARGFGGAAAAVAGSPSSGVALSLQAVSGLLPQTQSGGPSGWLVRPSTFSFSATTPVPITAATFAGFVVTPPSSTLDVYPLQWTGLASNYEVAILTEPLHGSPPQPIAFEVLPIYGDVPAALWGTPQSGPPQVPDGSQQLVADQLVGATLTAPPPTTGTSAGPMLTSVLFLDPPPPGELPLSAGAPPVGDQPEISLTSAVIAATVAAAAPTRATICAALFELGYGVSANDSMQRLANTVACALTAQPLLVPATGGPPTLASDVTERPW